jgi:hypothetical protein
VEVDINVKHYFSKNRKRKQKTKEKRKRKFLLGRPVQKIGHRGGTRRDDSRRKRCQIGITY